MGLFDRLAGTLDELTRDAITPADAREEIDLAMAFADRGDLALAEERLRELAERFPRLGAVHAHLGDVLGRRGKSDEAIAAYGRAVDRDADDPRGWLGLAECLAQLRRFEPARDAFRKVLALSVDRAQRGRAQAALGRLYAADGQLGRAARELHKALQITPDDGDLIADHGRVLVRDGDRAAGAQALSRAARLPGADVALFVEAADATDDPSASETLLRDGLARAPTHPRLRAALARQLIRNGRGDEGLTLALDSLAAAPDDPTALAAVREAYASAGHWTEALRAAHREAELGAPPPLRARLSAALGAQDRAALAAALPESAPAEASDAALVRAARAFLDTSSRAPATAGEESALRALAAVAPDAAARRFVLRALAPPPVPAGNLFALLSYAHQLANHLPALSSLALPAARAAEAFDRPLLVAVMGEFNAGKSSFVNALCGDAIAPVGVTPTTATVNILRYGPLGGRIVYQDGTARELGAQSVAPFLRELPDSEAAAIRVVEIFYPLELLRRVEIVDTPGLNSLRPEHEKVARDFLQDADAIVWLFAVGQAAKATEQQALALAHQAGKRVLGVLNKVDRADATEIAQVIAHVRASVGDLVDAVVPLAARAALEARRAGDAAALAQSGLTAVEESLETRFFSHARALKRTTALGALRRFVAEAGTAAATVVPAASAPDLPRASIAASEERVRGVLGAERVALRARIDEAYRGAAFEVRDFVRPRAWLFGEHRAEPADEEFLIDLLDDAIARATRVTRDALIAAIDDPDSQVAGPALPRAALVALIDTAVDRFAAYARGVIEGGAVAAFFRQDLPRIRLDLGAIRNALARRAPDPEPALFAPLVRDIDRVYRDAAAQLSAVETAATVGALEHDERVRRPLDELAAAVDALAAEPGPLA